ncbi:MAG: type II toxin-antitoxin system RelE/ParE family toxin [Acidimicrobiaceae bacterium]|nr:type II toxin-antitoxin system RelE/ParE family toxin [Acidimicrobiaceae bacterium]MYE08894.1 type II toxin-antitoxin system RelE/ParE family toxin [Acidimicrobiaceae bacterium]MYI35981.1 type II toxin-antitoxin system RelE/ParE family toxin [Acidimicrobiaceae bacterium]
MEVREYYDSRGRSAFGRWYTDLDSATAIRVRDVIARIKAGNFASLKGLGGGLLECRLHFGPGYRIYLGRDGHSLVILLAGGTKARQQQDIERARELWREYRHRKREEVRRGAHP